MKTHSQKFLQQRRFFTVLPLLVIPFLTLLFWALGGGKGISAEARNEPTGLNLELPKAYFSNEDENWNKFALYEKAKRDSLKYQQAKKNDPYYQVDYLTEATAINDKQIEEAQKNQLNASLNKQHQPIDPNEEKVNRKLEQLYRELDNTSNHSVKTTKVDYPTSINDNNQFSTDIDRLEQMMLMMQESSTEDPEMQQIEKVLEKILDIQYPERVQQRLKEQKLQNKSHTYPIKTKPGEAGFTSIEDDKFDAGSFSHFTMVGENAFYGLEDDPKEAANDGNAIEAVIHDTQELVRGSTIKLRLLNDVYINNQLIPRGQFIFGTCNINNERLNISIGSIRSGNNLLPVSLGVYDLDGLPGIYVPGAITDDIARQTTNQTLQDLDFYSFDPSLSAQAANAGIQASKSLLSKKVKEVKVTVKAGYKVLLKDTRNHS